MYLRNGFELSYCDLDYVLCLFLASDRMGCAFELVLEGGQIVLLHYS